MARPHQILPLLFGLASACSLLGAPTAPTPVDAPAGEANTPTEPSQATLEPDAPPPPDPVEHPDRDDLLETRCKGILDALTEHGGEPYASEVGTALYESKGFTVDEMGDLCESVTGKTPAEVGAVFSEASGVMP